MAGVGASAPAVRGGRSTVVPIVALDYPDSDSALELVSLLGESCRFYKIGSELFTASGPSIVEAVRRTGCDVFLDLKLHDIPNTVAGATRRIREMGVKLTTVHASGGRAMIEAAVEAAEAECGILAVTVLTSLDSSSLGEVIGAESGDVAKSVIRLAALAAASGARGVVCSGEEARQVRAQFGPNLELLVPGVRLPGDAAGDQSRIVTPEAAAAAGADYLVLGRTVTAAPDPRAAMQSVRDRLRI
ncbi:MAG TPA: orotidine-5'-phosphate decarboxylase [Gemmatimonadaceae bacterium]|nr:orotidine-5'-phosphate decarboxylase [Gemmatimonadaceae bacterium]